MTISQSKHSLEQVRPRVKLLPASGSREGAVASSVTPSRRGGGLALPFTFSHEMLRLKFSRVTRRGHGR